MTGNKAIFVYPFEYKYQIKIPLYFRWIYKLYIRLKLKKQH